MQNYSNLSDLILEQVADSQLYKIEEYVQDTLEVDTMSPEHLQSLVEQPEHLSNIREICESQEDKLIDLEVPHLVFLDITTLPDGTYQY